MSIESIHTTPKACGPMIAQTEAKLLAGVGIENDRYANLNGTYSVLKASQTVPGNREPGRQVTLISADELDAAVQRTGIALEQQNYGSLRRNIVLRGVVNKAGGSSSLLLDTIGSAIRLGSDDAVVFVHRHCVPCMYNEKKNGIKGLQAAIWDEAGVSCEVLVGGTIRVGDSVTVLTNEELKRVLGDRQVELDSGFQPPGFFLPPKERSAAMIKEGLERQKQLYEDLIKADPEGVERADRSYGSVGLSFWPVRAGSSSDKEQG